MSGIIRKSKNMGIKKIVKIILLVVILILGFTLRLYKVSNPIADWHSWRQADTSAVTRNFEKYGINLLYPKFDDFSDVSGSGRFNPNGYRFVEFPLFNLLHLLIHQILPGENIEFSGRITSNLAATTSGLLLFFLMRRKSNYTVGILSAFLYLTIPYNIYFTRVILPDPLMVTLFLLTLNIYDIFLQKKHRRYLWLTGIVGACAVLVKPVALFFLLPITVMQYKKLGKKIFSSSEFYIFYTILLLPFSIWRLWSYFHPEGVPASKWLLNGNGIRFKPSFFQWIFGVRIGTLILGKWGVWPFLVGVTESSGYILAMLTGSLLYLIVFATGNVQHDYYQLPIIPSIAAAMAFGIWKVWHSQKIFWRKLLSRTILIFSIGCMLGFGWYDIRGMYQINNWSIVKAGQELDRIAPKDAIVIAPYQGDTAFLYQTNRAGFAYLYKPIKDMIDRFHASYYISVNYDDDTNELMKKYTIVEKNPEFVILKLEEQIKLLPPQ